jgi:DNA-binding NarL/FixJ family response regulator
MMRTYYLAGIDNALVPMFGDVFRDAGDIAPASLARLNVTELGRLAPDVLICDVDKIITDQLEFLRQLRFVLPDCLIAIYTNNLALSWVRSCHSAGVNCVLAKGSDAQRLSGGLLEALSTGCYTDPGLVSQL